MAGLLCVATTPSEVTIGANIPRTLLMLTAPANHRLIIKRIRATFDGTSPTAEPGIVRVCRFTSAGTFTAGTIVLKGAGSESPLATFGHSASAEPTQGDVLEILEADRGYEVFYPLGMEIVVPGGTRIGIKAAFGYAVNGLAMMEYEE